MATFDFEQDIRKALHLGFWEIYQIKISLKGDLHECLLDYLTLNKKLIVPKVRNVRYNPELLKTLPDHGKFQEVLNLDFLFRNGKDVNYFQSKRVFETKFHDHLAYEWDIYHFHLSLEKEKKSLFAKQVDTLLFVYITENEAIFLGIDKHIQGVFGDIKWIEILHDHFPYTIEKFKNKHVADVYPHLDKVERQSIWNKGYTVGMTNVKGIVYDNPGIGRSTSGHSIIVGKTANEILRWVHTVTQQFSTYNGLVCDYFNVSENDAHFKLQWGQETLQIIEGNTNQLLLTYPEVLNITTVI